MKDLTLTQEYLLCALNEKGRLPALSLERQVCLVAAGLLELRLAGCAQLDAKRVWITGPLPQECAALRPLYDFLEGKGPVKLEKVVETYSYSLSDKHIEALLDSVGGSLAELGAARREQAGLFGGKSAFVPSREAVAAVVDMVRAELLEQGPVSDEAVALTALLDESGRLKDYFSKFEQKELRQRLKAIAATPEGRLAAQLVEYVENMIAIVTVLASVMGS